MTKNDNVVVPRFGIPILIRRVVHDSKKETNLSLI